ncbi:hypothetical protein EV697_102122 [Bisgaardia hudsonensis]|uniref:O-antigen ligase-like membrane protein n=1 Tax=Bisgaardia hudsonensis TaxID=109472 RepID=A0A4R2N151_9PAST|nr:hypothetical protein [Bisgaardia hudsonensis]QLB13178.1 hypothetical protein A6A11_05895 [Bisgaardia hudsonensis]TCP13248.1 hypothetical protein EV697_102122 [Bisgaardia hudsonensis]
MSAIFNLFYLYDPWLFHFFRMAFFVGFIAISYLTYKLYKKEYSQGVIIPLDSLAVIGILIVFTLLPLLIHSSRDFSVLFQYIKTLILFVFAIGIYNLFYFQHNGKVRFINDLKIGIGIQFVIGFLALLGITFIINFALSTHIVLPTFYGSEQEYRLYNFTSSAFFQLSAFYVVLLHFLLAYNKQHNSISAVYLFLILCIGLISGRTFLLLSIISIAAYFKLRYLPALLLFAGLCLMLAMNFADHKYVAHALEPLINLLGHKGLVSSSTDTLIEKHLFIPTLKQIMIGEGYYMTVDGHYYGGTDSGFLRQILYGGIVNVIVCLLFTAYFVRKIALHWFQGSWYFSLSTLAILSILNIKADTYAFPGLMLMLLMLLSLFGEKGNNLILFKNIKDE